MKPILLCLVAGLGLALPHSAAAGAWAQPVGHTYAKLSTISYHADEVYNDMGRQQVMGLNGDSFDGRQLFLYVEHGLWQHLTLVTQVSGGVLTDEDRYVRSETTGLGDVEVGLKYQWRDKPLVVAPMLSVKLPTGYHAGFEPALGTGKLDAEGRLLLSRSFYPLPLYGSVETGFRVRGGAFSNQWSWAAEVGATPHPRLFAKALAGGTKTFTDGVENVGLVGVSTQVSEGDYRKVGINAAVDVVGGVWLDLLWETTVDGQNIGAGSSWGIGLSVSR